MNSVKLTRVAAAMGAVFAGTVVISAQVTTPAAAPQPRITIVQPPPADGALAATQGFSVVLVLGDLQGGSTPDNLPAAAKRALADMKDFLPYKSYRLLDSEWILGSSNVSTRLRGADDQEYVLNMSTSSAPSRKLFVTFQLRDADFVKSFATSGGQSVAREKQSTEVLAERARLEKQIEMLRQRLTENQPDVARTQAELASVEKQLVEAEAQRAAARDASNAQVAKSGRGFGVGIGSGSGTGVTTPRASVSIISTSFTMDVGETVVVGTSRLRGGEKALIALLTAVPHGKTTTPKD